MISVLLVMLLQLVLLQRQEVENLFEGTGVDYKEKIYSGYLRTGFEGREHFYVFTPSQNLSKDKLMVIMFGGPGCSVFSNFFTETGPVRVNNQSNAFEINQHSWNKEVNLLYLESPAGVGFSQTDDVDHAYDDDENGKSHYASLIHFLEIFTEYKASDIYLGGQNYGGVFVSYLAKEILSHPEAALNLKGLFIGNGIMNLEVDLDKSLPDFGFAVGLFPPELKAQFKAECPMIDYPEVNGPVTQKCNEIRLKMKDCLEGNNILGIYDECYLPPPSETTNSFRFFNEEEQSIYPSACSNNSTMFYEKFLNSDPVKTKLHVKSTLVGGKWTSCLNQITQYYKKSDMILAVLKKFIMGKGVKVWFYSGDMDGRVPTLGSLRALRTSGWKIKKEYAQWRYNKQVAGFYQIYENDFSFFTVRGAGHFPPARKNAEMKYLLDSHFAGKLLQ